MTPEQLMEEGKKLLKSKGEDYTKDIDEDRYENFEKQAVVISWFESNEDKAFAALIAVKLARLSALRRKGKKINHESMKDTFIDLINYCALWGGFSL